MIKVGIVGAGFMGEMHANCHAAAKGDKKAAAVLEKIIKPGS